MLTRFPLALLTLAALGTAPAQTCPPGSKIDTAAVERRLRAAEALWRRRGPASYRLTLSFFSVWSFGGGVSVEVRGGRAVGGWEQEGARHPLPPGGRPPALPARTRLDPERAADYTVPALFQQVRETLRRTRSSGACGEMEVVFNRADGHPERLSGFNLYVPDDLYGVYVSGFERLP